MSNISFFAKQPNRKRGSGHLQRVSSMIRGNQIAERIGAKLNPTEGYEDDICIYVKPHVKPGNDFDFEGRPYLDICDSPDLYALARKHPEVPVITASEWNYDLMRKILPNKIVNIPEQHCNFERVKRNRKEVTVVGVIGSPGAFVHLPEGLEKGLKERNMELIKFSHFMTRQDVVDFYMKIDVQIIWRPYINYKKNLLMNPLKMVNSSSFGVPTIAYDEKTFEEMEGCYVPVKTLEEFFAELDTLRSDPKLYKGYADRCLKKAEEYYIDDIVELYKKLT